MSELNGTTTGTAGAETNRVRGRVKPAGSFFGGLYALRDKDLPETTLLRKVGPDGLNYAVRIPVAAPLTTDAIAEAAKDHGGRVRVTDAAGKSSSWGVTGAKAAETVRALDGAE